MIVLRVRPKVDERGGMPELDGRECVRLETLTITSLAGGMGSGAPSVGFVFDLPDGRYVIAETSLALFLAAAQALKGVHADDGKPPAVPDPHAN